MITSLIYILFITYSITGLQLIYGNINIPLGDIIAMICSVFFVFSLMYQLFVQRECPKLNLYGIKWYLLFLVIASTAIIKSPDHAVSVKYLFRKPVFYFAVYYISIGSQLIWHYKQKSHKLYNLICISSLFISVLSLVTSIYRIYDGNMWGIMDIPMITNNHKTLPTTLCAHLPFIFAMQSFSDLRLRQLSRVTLILSIIAIALSFSKTSWLGVVFIYLLWQLKDIDRHQIKAILKYSIILILFVSIILIAYIKLSHQSDIVRAETSRVILVVLTYNMFRESPIIGNGPGSFILKLQPYASTFKRIGFPGLIDLDAHGLIFKVVTETGILGLLFFIIFLIATSWPLLRKNLLLRLADNYSDADLFYAAFTAVVTLFFINSFFGVDTFSPRFWLVITVASVHSYLLPFKERAD